MEILNEKQETQKEGSVFDAKLQRRSFLQYAGAGAAVLALTAAGCKKDKVHTNFGACFRAIGSCLLYSGR